MPLVNHTLVARVMETYGREAAAVVGAGEGLCSNVILRRAEAVVVAVVPRLCVGNRGTAAPGGGWQGRGERRTRLLGQLGRGLGQP